MNEQILEALVASDGCDTPAVHGSSAQVDLDHITKQSLSIDATAQHIEDWFQTTPHSDLISNLANTIGKWKDQDLSRLRLPERDLTEKEVKELLKCKPFLVHDTYDAHTFWSLDAVIYLLMLHNQVPTFIALLDMVSTHEQFIILVGLKGYDKIGVLSCAVMFGRVEICHYLREHLSDQECYDMLCEHGYSGMSGLHEAVERNNSIFEALSLLTNQTKSFELLCAKNSRGLTVLSLSIYSGSVETFESIIAFCKDKQSELLRLAAQTDKKGNNSFHYAAGQGTTDFLTTLLETTFVSQTKARLSEILQTTNYRGERMVLGSKVKHCHSDNDLIYKWAIDCITSNHYLVFKHPSVLVYYNVSDREEMGESEAQSLIGSLTRLGLDVHSNDSFTKDQLFEAIEGPSGTTSNKNGQIVALMSHGSEGYIQDSQNTEIALTEIEQKMCAVSGSNSYSPKMMILQCCQTMRQKTKTPTDTTANATSDGSLDADPKGGKCRNGPVIHRHESYSPRFRDVCVLMSTGPGTRSLRGEFIPKLAKGIDDLGIEDDTSELMYRVKSQFPHDDVEEQVPSTLDSFRSKFLLKKSILPIYLNLKHDEIKETEMSEQASAKGQITDSGPIRTKGSKSVNGSCQRDREVDAKDPSE